MKGAGGEGDKLRDGEAQATLGFVLSSFSMICMKDTIMYWLIMSQIPPWLGNVKEATSSAH